MPIASTVCAQEGHKIESLRANDKLANIPGHGIASTATYVFLCSKCGLTLEEIQANEKRRTRSPRKPSSAPPANQETA